MLRMKWERVRRDWTQARLGAISGVSREYVNYYENGRRVPSLRDRRRLARVLGVDEARLLDVMGEYAPAAGLANVGG